MNVAETERHEKIRNLNDDHRIHGIGGRRMISERAMGVPVETFKKMALKVKHFDAFNNDNDPYGEHDGADFHIDGIHFSWKIHYYSDDRHHYSSPDPADLDLTTRVMTIKLFEEF